MKNKIYISILILVFNTSCDSQTSNSNKSKTATANKSKVEQKEKKTEMTDEIIETHIKNDPVKMKEIKMKAEIQSKKEVDKILLDLPLSKLLNQTQIDNISVLLKTNPTNRNSAFLSTDITNEISKLEKSMNNLNDKKLTVPKSIIDLYQNLISKKNEVENFINDKSTSQGN